VATGIVSTSTGPELGRIERARVRLTVQPTGGVPNSDTAHSGKADNEKVVELKGW
jgi:hypothetical protein